MEITSYCMCLSFHREIIIFPMPSLSKKAVNAYVIIEKTIISISVHNQNSNNHIIVDLVLL